MKRVGGGTHDDEVGSLVDRVEAAIAGGGGVGIGDHRDAVRLEAEAGMGIEGDAH